MSAASVPEAIDARRSPFAGAKLCYVAGFQLPPGTRSPVFDQDIWDFTAVVGLPVQLRTHQRRMDFTVITNPRWRLVAKELIVALLAPGTRRWPCSRAPCGPRCTYGPVTGDSRS